jgi:sRNA-binding regulator protein Hfq
MTTRRHRATAPRMGFALVVFFGLSTAAAAQPPNNDFANAAPILAGQTLNVSTVGATTENGEPQHGGSISGASAWWQFRAPVSGPVTVKTCASDFDTLLGVYTGTAVNALFSIVQNDNNPACPSSNRSQVTFSANAGTTYYIAVAGFGAGTGNAVISLEQVPLACDGRARLGSFNGDNRSDLVFRRADESFAIFLMNGFSILAAQVAGQIGDNFKIVGVGDFNGDGKSDFVIRRATDGVVGIVLMDGLNIVAAQQVGAIGTEWQFVGTGDFNGDGKSDLLFFKRSTREVAIILMNGFTVLAGQVAFALTEGLEIVGIGDFNADGRADIVARHQTDGRVFLLLVDGFTLLSGLDLISQKAVGTVGLEWTFSGVGDLNGDGRPDLVFRRGDGMLALYQIGGTLPTVQAAALLGPIGIEWKLVGVGDLDGDGKADLVFRRTDGALLIYRMNGFTILDAQIIGTVGTEWDSCYANPG